MPDLLLEIGLEEIPARMIAPAQAELAQRLQAVLTRENLLAPEFSVASYSTPRRLAVKISGVLAQQPNTDEILAGPASSIAFKNGEPTPAAQAFARKAGVALADLSRTTTPKGEYVTATVRRIGQSASAVIAAQLPKELAALYWPKNMYWRAGKPERFVRPLRWLLALLDSEVIPVEFAGIASNNQTYGHRILYGDQPIEIGSPAEYLAKLEAAYVLADVEARRHKIRKALDDAARAVPGIRWREDHPLIDAVTHLTEWPSALLGSFQAEYLTLPEEILVTVMRDHQKYFALEDAGGRLAPYFLAVLNTQADEQGAAVIRHGNERVLRSRFKDARFFWDFDQKIPLADRVELLKSVTFQKQLGSYWDKTVRNLRIAAKVAKSVIDNGLSLDRQALVTAVELAKTDLTSELVKEFTELQGIVGGRYAITQGLGETVSQAIYWQYSPASNDDPIPPSVEGQILGLADRMNSIVDMFAIGLEPTGSRDPFALRRAGNAVLRILADSSLPLTLTDLQQIAQDSSDEGNIDPTSTAVSKFLRERLSFYLAEVRGFNKRCVLALLAAQTEDASKAIANSVVNSVGFAEALTAMSGSEDFLAICSSFKRMKNIIQQAREKGIEVESAVSEPLFTDPAETNLANRLHELQRDFYSFIVDGRYREALELIASLRPQVDQFFESVMVMAPKPELRANRLALLNGILVYFLRIADFSEIVTP